VDQRGRIRQLAIPRAEHVPEGVDLAEQLGAAFAGDVGQGLP
jgi:hypothetical protein